MRYIILDIGFEHQPCELLFTTEEADRDDKGEHSIKSYWEAINKAAEGIDPEWYYGKAFDDFKVDVIQLAKRPEFKEHMAKCGYNIIEPSVTRIFPISYHNDKVTADESEYDGTFGSDFGSVTPKPPQIILKKILNDKVLALRVKLLQNRISFLQEQISSAKNVGKGEQ